MPNRYIYITASIDVVLTPSGIWYRPIAKPNN